MAKAALAGGLLCGLMAQALADTSRMYRWTDHEGRVHYGDVPSPNSVEVNPRVTPATDNGAAAARANAEECERRRSEVEGYRNAGKVTETNSLGETREYSEAERGKLIERAEKLARAACGENPRP